jgi:hypothetical protein
MSSEINQRMLGLFFSKPWTSAPALFPRIGNAAALNPASFKKSRRVALIVFSCFPLLGKVALTSFYPLANAPN